MNKRLSIETLHMLTALTIVLIYFYTLDLFQPRYPMLHKGVTWIRVYDTGLTDMNPSGILPLIVVFTTLIAYCVYRFDDVSMVKLSTYITSVLVAINLIPLLYWIIYMYNPTDYTLTVYSLLPYLDAGLFHIYAPVYPLLLLSTLYAWLPISIIKTFKKRVRLKIRHREPPSSLTGNPQPTGTFMEKLGITSIILLGVALPIIPYLPTINPYFKPASVDIYWYSKWLNNMLTTDQWNAINYAFYGIGNGNRPLYLLLLYCLVCLGLPRDLVLNLEALYVAPLFALAIYFSAKRLYGNTQYALQASLAGLLGFNMTVGMYAGFYAAWMALIPFYICIMLTPRLEKTNRSSIGLIIASTVTLYIHPWTWTILMTVLTLYLIVQTFESVKRGSIHINRSLLLTLLLNIGIDLFKTVALPAQGGLISSITVLSNSRVFGFKCLLELSENLNRLTNSYVGGLFFNPLHTLLALIGILSLSNRRDECSKLLLLWIIVPSLAFPLSDVNLQSHILFAYPFPIVIAEGLQTISGFVEKFDHKLSSLIKIFFIFSSLVYAVRALCNIAV